jgi:hypothetical protein
MRTATFPLMACLALLLLPPSSSFAQQRTASSCDIPLVLTRYDVPKREVQLVKHLRSKDIEVQLDGTPVTLKGMSIDDGPKRVALLLDASRKVGDQEWKLQAEMAASLLEHARPADRFTLLYTGAEGGAASFLSPQDAVEQLRKAAASRPVATDTGEKNYDAVLEAVNRLDPPAFGDAVFLFGRPNDFGSKTAPEQLQELLLKHNLRFYGLTFSNPLEGKLRGVNLNRPLPPQLLSLVSTKLTDLSTATGYFFSFHSVRDLEIPGQTQWFRGFLGDLYAGIASPYRLTLPAMDLPGPIKVDMTLLNMDERDVLDHDIHYPQFVYPCEPAPPSTN